MRRRIVPVAVAATLVMAGLTGCAGSAGPSADCTNPLQPGPLSDGVTVGGDSGISVQGPSDILNAQRSVLQPGDGGGTESTPGGIVTANVTMYDAATGKVLDQRENAPHLVLPSNMLSDVKKGLASEQSDSMGVDVLLATALLCTSPGERLIVASTPTQSMASQLGTAATVVVVDVLDAAPDRAEGSLRGLPNGFPAVTTDDTGRPGIVLPPQAAPSKIKVAPRIVGTGKKVTDTNSVIGQALTVSWSGSVVANTWDSGMTGFGTEEQPNPSYTFRGQLTGYPVGSQIVILDPNKGDPQVHVVDIISAS